MRFLIALLLFANVVQAKPSDYAKYFVIDLEAELPTYQELYQKYIKDSPTHDRKYEHTFLIGDKFDKIFKQTIKIYGSSEQRLKTANEDELIEMLNSVPKETWQYIGPFLHTVPGISEKVLNMPGIKETKNKFPTRIAPQLKDIEGLEFLSPHMYYILMPEIWPEYYKDKEIVIKPQKQFYPKVKYDPNYFQELKEIVANQNSPLDDLRTLNIQPSSKLTSGDVKAFVNTLTDVDDFGSKNQNQNLLKISHAGSLLDIYEAQNGTSLPINALKGVVNPCQREVQKIIVAGLYQEFLSVVGKRGFTPETWAVTCDKTIKAYRVANMSINDLKAVTNYKNGIYNQYIINNLNLKTQGTHFATIESVIQMHKAPLSDVLAVRKNLNPIREGLLKSQNMILSSPVAN